MSTDTVTSVGPQDLRCAWSMVQVQQGLNAWKVVQAIHKPFMECLKGVCNTVNQSNVHSLALAVEEGGGGVGTLNAAHISSLLSAVLARQPKSCTLE